MSKRSRRSQPAPDLSHIAEPLRPLAVPVEGLVPDPANARRHDDKNLEAIVSSLRRFGQQKPVVVDGDGIVRAGSGTLDAARRLGWTHVAASRTELTGADATAYAIADNRTAELAAWDEGVLAEQLKALGEVDISADALGFDTGDLQALEASLAAAMVGESPADPEPPERFDVLCEFSCEAEQVAFLERMETEGIKCRSLIA